MSRTTNYSNRKSAIFPPWFLSKKVARQIDELLPYYYHMRFRFYFDRYGCIRCASKDQVYCCSGLCLPCQGLISDRLKRTDKLMHKLYGPETQKPTKAFLKRLTSARELLADLRGKS